MSSPASLEGHQQGRGRPASERRGVGPERSARPGRGALGIAAVAILLAGLCGGLIGFALVDVSCTGSCAVPAGVGILTGAVASAAGVAIVASLTLRAMNEWRTTGRRAQQPRRTGPTRSPRMGQHGERWRRAS